MKKKVLQEINALANKIIVEGSNIETSLIRDQVLQLYEKLTILNFLETRTEVNIELPDRDAIDSKTYREENWFQDPKPVPQSQYDDEIAEPLMEKIKDIVAQMPSESDRVDELLEEILPKNTVYKNELEDFASTYQEMPVFERKDQEVEKENDFVPDTETKIADSEDTNNLQKKPKSLNDKLNKSLDIGLNDRLAFIKQLFGNNSDDYSRVISQINTMSSYKEANNFIETNVKPDYNNWIDKDQYVERFMLIVEKQFN